MAQAISQVPPKSAIRKHPRNKGFTFIELLVVLLIIAVVSGAIVLGVGYFSERSAVKSVAERLHQIVPLAREYAALHSVVLKLEIEKGRYALHQLEEKGLTEESWKPLLKPEFLKPQHFPEYVVIELKAHSILFQEEEMSLFKHPIIEILPSMEIEPFILSIGTENEPDQYELSVQKNGVVELKRLR